ncbi:MarR family winged helix-turn-helix transcriptional regulator [Sphaerisporangium fuscum]|uniref:MarR family winged helix-turn-helix transcriptional regulator n=1 Tax=Sphaerisporangium fuscum TaxID=2835868 RepID=UPI001BDDC5A1|nr:MarR family transcriptional regulator [Sphaerisporangium fuscum]
MTTSEQLAEDLRAAIGRLVRTTRAVDTLPPGEAAILGYLDREGPQTITDLARRRQVSHQSAAKSVKELTTLGLVHAAPHPTDGRMRVLVLTPAGRARLDDERHRRADRLGHAIEHALTPAEREELQRCVGLLSRLSALLESGSP